MFPRLINGAEVSLLVSTWEWIRVAAAYRDYAARVRFRLVPYLW